MVTAAFSEGSLKNLLSPLASGVTLPRMTAEPHSEHRRCRWPQAGSAERGRAPASPHRGGRLASAYPRLPADRRASPRDGGERLESPQREATAPAAHGTRRHSRGTRSGEQEAQKSPASLAALSPLFTQLYSPKTSASPRLITKYDTHLLSHTQIRLEKKPGTVQQ